MGPHKPNQARQTDAHQTEKREPATTPKKKFKLHRMTKKELLETRIPVYDYLIP